MIQARNLVPGIGDYSTSEQDTGFTWIDGKTIHKKTIEITNIPAANGATETAHGISNLSTVIKIESIGYNTGDGGRYSPMPQTFNAMMFSSGSLAMRITQTKINLSANSNGCGQSKIYVTLYYTKTS